MTPRETIVRTEVDALLRQAPAWDELAPDERGRIREDMVHVATALCDAGPMAVGLAANKPGENFRAGAIEQGTKAFRQLVDSVDFPAFVSGLIQGVFRAVVDASIQQMQAYGEMLAAVAKSVEQFGRDNFTDQDVRGHVAGRYPGMVELSGTGSSASVRPRSGVETTQLVRDYGLPARTDLSSPEGEAALLQAVRLDMARSRQQMLATMVLMGINRIVVTNGRINAKVLFDVAATDTASENRHDARTEDKASSVETAAIGFSPWGGGGMRTSNQHRTSVTSVVDTTSDAKAEMKAKLSGDVDLQFRSETFPLERMADMQGMTMIQTKAAPRPLPGG